jgi:hypothetical protein
MLIQVTDTFEQIVPIVVVDLIAWWEPRKEGPVDLSDVKNWILALRRKGVNLGQVTFDRWNSFDIQKELQSVGLKTDTLSVLKPQYEDLAMLVYEDRVVLPHIELLLNELTELKVVNDRKVDHPRKGSKDLADAMCGAVYNAISLTPRDVEQEIDIHTWAEVPDEEKPKSPNPNTPPPMTNEAEEFLMNFGLI